MIQRRRDQLAEMCRKCGVSPGELCRNLVTGATYATMTHGAETNEAENDLQSVFRRPPLFTTNATPVVGLEVMLPDRDGAIVYLEGVVLARSATNHRMWRRAALLERAAGSWSVLGSVFDMPTPAASAGASAWAMNPSLPGNDVVRLTFTGAAATIGWFPQVEMLVF